MRYERVGDERGEVGGQQTRIKDSWRGRIVSGVEAVQVMRELLTNTKHPPIVWDDLLNACIGHLLEARSYAKYGAARNHLWNRLSRSADHTSHDA